MIFIIQSVIVPVILYKSSYIYPVHLFVIFFYIFFLIFCNGYTLSKQGIGWTVYEVLFNNLLFFF